MPPTSEFPHLHLAYRGQYTPKYPLSPRSNEEAKRNRADSATHATRLRHTLDRWVVDFEEGRRLRDNRGLPVVPAAASFVLRVPEGSDGDAIAYALGVDLVAETSEGLMLMATTDISVQKMRGVIDAFELSGGSGQAGNLLDVYTGPDDPRRLEQILAPEVLALWPFEDCSNRRRGNRMVASAISSR
jgi:hypothetical protein